MQSFNHDDKLLGTEGEAINPRGWCSTTVWCHHAAPNPIELKSGAATLPFFDVHPAIVVVRRSLGQSLAFRRDAADHAHRLWRTRLNSCGGLRGRALLENPV